MAKPKKDTDGASFDATRTPEYVTRIEELQGQIDEIMQEAQKQCAPLREDIAAIKKEATENDSLPRKELNAVVRQRRLLAKADSVRGSLSEPQQATFDSMWDTFEDVADVPLGRSRTRDGAAAAAH